MDAVAKRKEMTDEERAQRTQARVGLASNVLGLTAGTAALVAAAKNPALKKPMMSNAGPVTGKIARRMGSKDGRRKLIRAGAAGALALQAGNMAGDVVANRVLAREAGKGSDVKKSLNRYRSAQGAAATMARRGHLASVTQQARANAARRGKEGVEMADRLKRVREAQSASTQQVFGKSIEQSVVSKSAEVRVTGRGVNLSKATTKQELDDWYEDSREKSKKMTRRVTTPTGAVLGGATGGALAMGPAANMSSHGKAGALIGAGALAGSAAGAAFGHHRGGKNVDRIYNDQGFKAVAQAGRLKQIRAENELKRLPKGKKPVEKRYFDAEDDRQRRLGMYAGLGLAGGAGAAAYAGKDVKVERTGVKEGDKVVRRGVKATIPAGSGKKKAAAAALAAAGLIGGGAAYRHSVSERNRRWT